MVSSPGMEPGGRWFDSSPCYQMDYEYELTFSVHEPRPKPNYRYPEILVPDGLGWVLEKVEVTHWVGPQGMDVRVAVTYVLRGGFGMPSEYCVMSVEIMS